MTGLTRVRRGADWHVFPAWKRWGLFAVMLFYWSGRILEARIDGTQLLVQVLWSGQRPPEELPWLVLVICLETLITLILPIWYTRQAVCYPAVRLEERGIRLAWPLPPRVRLISWESIRGARRSLGFSGMDLSSGGTWLLLQDSDQIPISYGLTDGVQLVDELEARLATRDP